MPEQDQSEKSIFLEAIDIDSAAERAAFLEKACGGRPGLRDKVEALLQAHDKPQPLLDVQLAGAPTLEPPPEHAGTVIGPYRLMEQIGEGGMGLVFVAEQREPVRRKVALKVIKPGMDSRAVIARFEAERQALALMDHPHIAKVLDGGATAGGRPYFVMELVEGVPLTEFCNRERLAPRERLGLFLDVCRAVQHAHQKGIIHRDLKPSNVLASRQDPLALHSPPGAREGGMVRGTVKVIDFGVAKALQQRLTEKTLVTGVAQVVGTPLYMSPEQAEPGAADIDTRSDIYALGMLLYELLTGTTPFERERLSQASFDELRRIIREEEPPRPSTRISTLGPAAATLSEQRRTHPRQLGQLLRGELDWVVMKCLEKDPSRRYETADALARDIARYLADEPVEACPPSVTYRLGKFLRKHRRALGTAAAFLSLLVAAGVLVGWQAVRETEAEHDREVREARAERDRAVEEAKRGAAVRDALDQVRALREEARKGHDPGKWAKAREQAQRALALVENGAADRALAAQVKQVQDELDGEEKDRRLVADLEAARLAQGETAAGQNRFANERAIPWYRKALRAYGLPVGEGDPATAAARLRGRPLEVRQAVSAVLDEWLDLAADPSLQVREPHLSWLHALAATELDGGQMRELRAAAREPDPTRRRAALERLARAADLSRWPPAKVQWLARRLEAAQATPCAVQLLQRAWRQYPADFWVNNELGNLLRLGQPPHLAEAVRHLTAAVALRPDSPGAHLNLGAALEAGGRFDEAIACFRRALVIDPTYAMAHHNLAVMLRAKGRWDQAIACSRRAIKLDPKMALGHCHLGEMLSTKGRLDEAITCFRRAIKLDPKHAAAANNLGLALQGKGRLDEAIACYRRAIKLDPKQTSAYLNLSGALVAKGRLDEAIACARRAVELEPKKAEAHCNLGAALAHKGRLDEAIASYRRALRRDPKHAKSLCNLGIALKSKGRLDEAIDCFRRAIESDPKSAAAHFHLALALNDKGQPDEAVACYRRAIELDPNSALLHYNLGCTLDAMGRRDEAIACYRRAIELDPKDVSAIVNLGRALHAKGMLEEAIACYRRAIEIDPRYAIAHCNLGIALDAKGRTDQAIASFRRAVLLDPKLEKGHYSLGNALLRRGQRDEAIACFRRAIALDPKDAFAHCNLGAALVEKDRVDDAITCFRKALQTDPKLANAYCNLGIALVGKGQVDEAIACYKRAIALAPKDAVFHYNLGDALYRKRQLDEAIARYHKALALDPKYAKAHCELGVALAGKGQLDEAIASYQKALALDPRLARAHYSLGKALQGKGQLDEAIACCRRAIELDPKDAEAHCNLGHALQAKGEFRPALAALGAGHALASGRKDWRFPSADWVKRCERFVQLDDLLAAIRKGKGRPAGAVECLELADFCRDRKQHHAAAVRFYIDAFAAEPKQAADLKAAHRYHAALSAALACCGRGKDTADLNAAERARLRRQALTWLRADLALWTKQLETGSKQARRAARARMQAWLSEPSLAAVRDVAGLAGLSAAERRRWQTFWAEVRAAWPKARAEK
jgi:tetratricopeptide (TPR) repeat protein